MSIFLPKDQKWGRLRFISTRYWSAVGYPRIGFFLVRGVQLSLLGLHCVIFINLDALNWTHLCEGPTQSLLASLFWTSIFLRDGRPNGLINYQRIANYHSSQRLFQSTVTCQSSFSPWLGPPLGSPRFAHFTVIIINGKASGFSFGPTGCGIQRVGREERSSRPDSNVMNGIVVCWLPTNEIESQVCSVSRI